MKVIQLHAENYKRLGVVDITPEGNLITIGGKNGNGKSSVLDAIFVALKGRAVAPPRPIREGEDKATIRLDMGDVIVTRNFHRKDGGEYTDTLKVENGEGLRFTNPQAMLSALLGEIGFDPFEFVNLKPKEQVNRLLGMVPLSIDLDEFKEADASAIAKRRDVNRDANALKARIEGIPKEEVPVDAPDRNALTDKLGTAADTNAAINRERDRRERAEDDIEDARSNAAKEREAAADLRRQADAREAMAAELEETATARAAELAALPPLDDFVDTDAIRVQLREAEEVLAKIEQQKRRDELLAEWQALAAESKDFTDAITQRAEERNKALAEAEMPVEGLTFAIDEEGEATLMWEGLPFDKDQISTAVQLRVSTAIGMAANPRLRVLRIKDGSLLDDDSMAMLAEMAETEDFQLWVEVVGDGGVGIIMENGVVRGSEQPADANQPDQPEAKEDPAQDGPTLTDQRKAKKAAKAKPATEGGLL